MVVGAGKLDIEAPRVHDKREGLNFSSNILPSYLRKSANVESLLPILYLKGLSTGEFKDGIVVTSHSHRETATG